MDRKKIKKGYYTIIIGLLLIVLGIPLTILFQEYVLGEKVGTLFYYLIFGGVGFFILQSGIVMLKVECPDCRTLNWFHAKKCKSCSSPLEN